MIGSLKSDRILARELYALSKKFSDNPNSRITQVQSLSTRNGLQQEMGLHYGGFRPLGEYRIVTILML
jgi:hypothetical protein